MPDKVNFDHGKANDAIRALRDAAAKLQSYQKVEDPLRSDALQDWTGPYGDTFRTSGDKGQPWIAGETTRLIAALNNTAQAIEDAGNQATKLNGP